MLQKNTSHTGIILNKIALADTSKLIIFHDVANGEGGTTLSSRVSSLAASEQKQFHTISVNSSTLDQYCLSHNVRPSFLKIDIEGCEFNMLQGGEKTILACKPIIAMEVWRSPNDYSNHLKAIDFLIENGYTPFRINDYGDLEQMSNIVPDRDISKDADNFVFKVLQ